MSKKIKHKKSIKNAPCERCYKHRKLEKFTDGTYLCKKCIQKLNSLLRMLEFIIPNTEYKITFTYSLSSEDWEHFEEQLDGKEKIESLLTDLRMHITDMSYLQLLKFCKIELE